MSLDSMENVVLAEDGDETTEAGQSEYCQVGYAR